MTLPAFQQALCELIASPSLCVAARADATAFLTGFDLSERERRRLQDIVRQRGMTLNCTLYRSNRITPLYTLLHLTCVVLGDTLKGELDVYWASAELRDLEFEHEINRFAHFLRQRIAAGAITDPLIGEVLDFELAVNQLRFAARRRIVDGLNASGACADDATAVLHPLVRVVRFEHDAREVLTALAQGLVPRGLQRSESFLVLSGVDAELSVKEIEPRNARLLWRMQTAGLTCRYADVRELVAQGVVVSEVPTTTS